MTSTSKFKRSSLVAAALLTAASFNIPTASAMGPAAMGAASPATFTVAKSGTANGIEEVRWGRRGWGGGPRWHRHRGGGWWGPGLVGAGIAGLIIGGSIASSRADYNDRWEQCADTYRSFSWRDGTYQPYEGPRQLCPYLRR